MLSPHLQETSNLACKAIIVILNDHFASRYACDFKTVLVMRLKLVIKGRYDR